MINELVTVMGHGWVEIFWTMQALELFASGAISQFVGFMRYGARLGEMIKGTESMVRTDVLLVLVSRPAPCRFRRFQTTLRLRS